MNKPVNVHGTGLLLGEAGVLLRGPSGSGKSLLALSLLDRWEGRGWPAFLVADDRVDLLVGHGGLVMQAPKPIAAMIELRGRGIIERPYRDSVVLRLVVDLVPELVRMPEPDAFRIELVGVGVARAPVPVSDSVSVTHQMLLVAEAIAQLPRP